jgi:predicted RNase H-like HicB family nuclease
MKVYVVLRPGEDGAIIAECPQVPGCISQGSTREEALSNIRDALDGCIAVRRERGWPALEELTEVDVIG